MINFDIVTICNEHRKPLIENYLKDIPHITHYSEDYNLSENWKVNPCYKGLALFHHQHVGHLRCCCGHRDALLKTTKDYILVIEDDAVPNKKNWLKLISPVVDLLDKFELVSVHGREFDVKKFNVEVFNNKNGIMLFTPKDNTSPRWVLGSLAYFVRRDVIDRFVSFTYQGMGQDLFNCNCFNFALVDPSVFDHDRTTVKSLIDK